MSTIIIYVIGLLSYHLLLWKAKTKYRCLVFFVALCSAANSRRKEIFSRPVDERVSKMCRWGRGHSSWGLWVSETVALPRGLLCPYVKEEQEDQSSVLPLRHMQVSRRLTSHDKPRASTTCRHVKGKQPACAIQFEDGGDLPVGNTRFYGSSACSQVGKAIVKESISDQHGRSFCPNCWHWCPLDYDGYVDSKPVCRQHATTAYRGVPTFADIMKLLNVAWSWPAINNWGRCF